MPATKTIWRILMPAAVGAVLGVAALAALPSWIRPLRPSHTPPPAPTGRGDVETAIRRGLAVLQEDGDAWMAGKIPIQNGQACISCHQVPFGVWGLKEAERVGIVADAAQAADLTERALEFAGLPQKGRVMSWGPLLLGVAASEHEASLRDFVDFALARQEPAGLWKARGQFPSQRRALTETNAVATMWTILALDSLAANDEAIAASIGRAFAWVDGTGAGESTEWLLLRALTEERRGGSAAARTLRSDLVAQQNADGGWGWLPGEASNAYSTGQVLYGLELGSSIETEGEEEALARTFDYLLQSQGAEGVWPVSSSLTSSDDNASKDYVYGYWGTAWATIGLARSLEPAINSREPAATR